MDRPTFFILGATKSGTTTLHRELGRHPDILMSRTKEPAFFAVWYEHGLPAFWRAEFSGWAGQRAVGVGPPRVVLRGGWFRIYRERRKPRRPFGVRYASGAPLST